MLQLTLPIELVALLASILTEVTKMIPAIGGNKVAKTITAMVLTAVGALLVNGFKTFTVDTFVGLLVWVFLNYKIIVQPLAKEAGLRTQE